jgi:GNAT superfamily N-acetyltransferase
MAPDPERGDDGSNHESFCVGVLYVWKRGDPLPAVEAPSGFSMVREERASILTRIGGIDRDEVGSRIRDGHVPYVVSMNGEPVAYGWSAWRKASIGELGLSFELAPGDHYLWDFVTMPDWRRRGIYRRMIQEILTIESDAASRFWIGHDLDNVPSGKGILTAGFTTVGGVWIVNGQPVFKAHDGHEDAAEAAELLEMPLSND